VVTGLVADAPQTPAVGCQHPDGVRVAVIAGISEIARASSWSAGGLLAIPAVARVTARILASIPVIAGTSAVAAVTHAINGEERGGYRGVVRDLQLADRLGACAPTRPGRELPSGRGVRAERHVR